MRDIILGRKVGTTNTVVACERRILEFPGMDAREVAKELKARAGTRGGQISEALFSVSSAFGKKREADNADDSSQASDPRGFFALAPLPTTRR